MTIFDHIKDRSLAHITRFSSTPQHFRESVADHSFFVTYITSLLCLMLKGHNEKVNYEKATTMALIHDREEMFSGDILGPFKHHSEEVTSAIRKVNRARIKEVFKGLPQKLREHYITLWNEEGEQKSIEAQIVKVADQLSLLSKCAEELRAGNEFFREIYEREHTSLQNNNKPWWQKIKKEVLG